MKLETATRMLGPVMVVDCRGKIIFGEEASSLREQVTELLKQHPRIVLNLAEVTSVDSNGVGTLVGLWAAAQQTGGEIKLAGLGPRVQDVLRITRLNALFGIYESVEKAAAA